jgi:hypothetical protein
LPSLSLVIQRKKVSFLILKLKSLLNPFQNKRKLEQLALLENIEQEKVSSLIECYCKQRKVDLQLVQQLILVQKGFGYGRKHYLAKILLTQICKLL